MTPKSFSVRIFLQDGHADGVKILSKSKWRGRGMVIPRSSLATELDRKELDAPAVYILVDTTEVEGLPTLFVSAADPICDSLRQDDSDKSFWDQAIVFASKEESLSLAEAWFIISRLQQLARKAQRSQLIGAEIPRSTKASGTEEVDLFLDHILSLLPLLGVSAFEQE